MSLPREELQRRLETELIGKELDLSTFYNRTARLVEDLLKKELTILGKDEETTKWLGSSCKDRNYLVITYKQMPLMTICVKTKREYKHEPYSSKYYAYFIQSVVVADYYVDFETRVAGIEKAIEEQNAYVDRKLNEAYELYKMIRQALPTLSESDIRERIRNLYDHRYSVENMFEKESSEL